jgi:hypothetical protein
VSSSNSVNAKVDIKITANGDQAVKEADKVTESINKIGKNKTDISFTDIGKYRDEVEELSDSLVKLSKNTDNIDIFKYSDQYDWLDDFESDIKEINKEIDPSNLLGKISEFINTPQFIKDARGYKENNLLLSFFDDISDKSGISSNAIRKFAEQLANVTGVTNGVTSEMSNFLYILGLSEPEIAVVIVAIKALKVAIDLLKKAWKFLSDSMDEAIDKLSNVGINIVSGIGSGIEEVSDSISEFGKLINDIFQSLIDIVTESIDKLQSLADVGMDIYDEIYQIQSLIGSEGTSQLEEFTEKLDNLYNMSGSVLLENLTDITAAVAAMGVSGDELVTASEALTVVGENLSVFAGSFEKASEDLGNAISKGYIGRASSLYKVFTKNELTEFKSLNSEMERYNYIMNRASRIKDYYTKYLETEAGKVSLLKQQYQELTNRISEIALKLYGTVAPLLTKLLKLANAALESLVKLFGLDLKSNNMASVADNITEALKAEAEAADNASRKTASFDDVIQISDSSTDSSSLDSLDYGQLSDVLSDFIEDEDEARTKWDDFIDKIKSDIESGDWDTLGSDLAGGFDNLLKSIDWKSVYNKSWSFGKEFADFLRGILYDEDLFSDIGSTLGNGLNTITIGINSWFKELRKLGKNGNNAFKQLGTDISSGIRSFIDSANWGTIGSNIAYGLLGIKDTFVGFVRDFFTLNDEMETGFTSLGKSIGEILNGMLRNISDTDVSEFAVSIVDFISGILNMIVALADTIDFEQLGNLVDTFISKFSSTLLQNSVTWGSEIATVLNDIISGIDAEQLANSILNIVKSAFNFLGSLYDTIDKKKIKEDIKTFVTNLVQGFAQNAGEWGTIANEWISFFLDLIQEVLATADINGIISALNTFLSQIDLKKVLWTWLSIKLNLVLLNLIVWWNKFKAKVGTVIDVWTGNFKLQFIAIKLVLVNFWDVCKTVANGVVSVFKSLMNNLSKIVDKIKGFFSGLGDTLSGIGDSIANFFNLSSGSITVTNNSQTSKIKIPKLATGGILTQATAFIGGEAGKEAVLPLENNTSWMDTFASKLAGKINNGTSSGNNQQIILDFSSLNREVYTRNELLKMGEQCAKALKLYGANVSMIK